VQEFPRQAWQKPAGRRRGVALAASINLLILVSIVVSVTAITLFGGLKERQRGISAAARESVVWGVFQGRIEVKDFIEAIVLAMASASDAALEEVVIRYDVLYSRADLFVEGTVAEHTASFAETDALAREIHASIMTLAPSMDRVAGDPSAMRAELPGLLVAARGIDEMARQLATAAKTTSNLAAVADRKEVSDLYAKMAAAVLALVAVIALIVILQGIHLRQIARAAEAAEAGTRAKSAFLAAMSHEIRTPLNGIVGMSEILDRSGLSADQAGHLAVIRQSGALLLDVINDILDFSKVESGRAEIAPREFTLSELAQSLRAVFLPRMAAKGLDFSVDMPDVSLTSDPARIRQILVNLVGNALKFTGSGSVRVLARQTGEGLMRFEVRDTGIGIAADAMPQLFQEFSQIESGLARRYEGTGLGLAICKRLAEALGGRIAVESQPGRGSLFWFELPCAPIVARPQRRPAHSPVEAGPTPRFRGHALVVEDNPTNQLVTCGMLKHLGLRSTVAENGRSALDMLATQEFDLALIDMQMPVLDGLATAREIRARGLQLPLIGLSANVLVSDRQDCFDAGMDDFLSKPVTLERMAESLQLWLHPKSASSPDLSAFGQTQPRRANA
jgi:two-component system, sensor histidine kinase